MPRDQGETAEDTGIERPTRNRTAIGVAPEGAPATWVEERTKTLDEIKKLTPEDRLGYYAGILKLNRILYESVKGWSKWLMTPEFMETFQQQELEEIFGNFREFTEKFLDLDIKWTDKKEKKVSPKERPEPQFLWG